MDIIYKKDTLYVYIREDLTCKKLERLERRADKIMETYGIEKLVVDTGRKKDELLSDFEHRYNARHRMKVVVR